VPSWPNPCNLSPWAFAHDTEVHLKATVVLANSALKPGTLVTIEDLGVFSAEFRYLDRCDHDGAELEAVRAIRGQLLDMLTAERHEAAAIVNGMLANACAGVQLLRGNNGGWHLHAAGLESDLSTHIVVGAAMAMLDVIRANETSRISRCAEPDCDRVVLDLSRNRSKKFCSTTCGNRNAVAACRARQRG
jgi:predicted RNA-binding Zn ribbon-like protein